MLELVRRIKQRRKKIGLSLIPIGSLLLGFVSLWLQAPLAVPAIAITIFCIFLTAYFIHLYLSNRYLVRLLQAMPVLFRKTTHLREHLSFHEINGYRHQLDRRLKEKRAPSERTLDSMLAIAMELRRYANGALLAVSDDGKQSFVLSDIEGFIAEGAQGLLDDLRLGITRLTGKDDCTCSLKLCVGEKDGNYHFISIYATQPLDKERVKGEEEYLAGKSSSLPQRVLDTGGLLVFDKLAEVSEDHHQNAWPNSRMKKYVNSAILCTIAVDPVSAGVNKKDTSGLPIAVLQVDSSQESYFTSWFDIGGKESESPPGTIAHMVRCTADALGVLISCSLYVQHRFCRTKAQKFLKSASKMRSRNEDKSISANMSMDNPTIVAKIAELQEKLNREQGITKDLSSIVERIHEELALLSEEETTELNSKHPEIGGLLNQLTEIIF